MTALPPAAPRRPSLPGSKTVAEKFCAWFNKFNSGNAAVIEAKRISDRLDFNQRYRAVEIAIRDLGEALGADSTMPESTYDHGPDNFWFWDGTAYVIEVKNENKSSLHKKDSGQLHDSMQWARTAFPEHASKLIPVTVANVTKADTDAHYPPNTRVLTADGCATLGKALHQLCQKLATAGPIFVTPANVLEEMNAFGLTQAQFVGRHTKPIS